MQSDTIAPVMQLETTNSITNNYSVLNKFYNFTDNELILSRRCDTFIPEYIKTDIPINFLQLIIGNIKFNFELNFCNIISKFNSEESYTYRIPWELFNKEEIPVISLQYNQISFKIISNNVCNAKLYVKEKFYNENTRRLLSTQSRSFNVRQYQEMNVIINNQNNEIETEFEGFINGIFLNNININELENIQLFLNNYIRFDYDKTMINLLSTKFINDIDENKSCLYIPFDDQCFNSYSFESSINFNQIDNIIFKINSRIQQNIKLIALSFNRLNIAYGMCAFAYTSTILLDHERVNQDMVEILNNQSNTFENNIDNYVYSYEHKKINVNDNNCPISLKNIDIEKHYMTCEVCSKNFLAEYLIKWIDEHTENCPMCRSEWKFRKIYINV